jgi:glucose/arabinose dehydrogenase
MIRKLLHVIIILFITGTSINAQFTLQNAFPNLTFNSAVFLTHADDNTDRIFIVEQSGRIKVFPNSSNASSAKEYLNITDRVTSGGEMGLLGLAFHPDYENNGYFYVNYTTETPTLRTVISRFQVTSNPDSADKNSEFEILTFNQPYQNHNGGWIGFGPNDGYLYIAVGDGGSGGDPQNYAQRINTLLGKILCIDVDGGTPYAIPPTNPFYDSTGNVKKEIYAWGLRNPWRCSFDPITGKLWAGDVGQNTWEEIDIIENGKNYGWRCYEGTHPYNTSGCNYPEYINPIWEYPHGAECSITGGYVYRGPSVPELAGKYIYGDYCSRKIWALEYDGITPPTNQYLLTAPNSITSFGVDQNNELHITSSDGKIYRFTPTITDNEPENNPTGYFIEQNYPNPFNPSTMIKYNLPEDSDVAIKIYDALGKEIDSITTGIQQKGSYQKTWSAEKFSSGVYLVKMNAKSLSSDKTFSRTIKMIYLK